LENRGDAGFKFATVS